MKSLEKYLDDLEKRLIPDQEQQLWDDWMSFAGGNWEENRFAPTRQKQIPPSLEWPEININDAHASREQMVLKEFTQISARINSESGMLLSVRSNYGVGIMASLYGAEKFMMPYEMDCSPNVRALPNGEDDLRNWLDQPLPDLENGWGADVFKTGELFNEIFADYPAIARFVATDHPDCQGPVDILELLWGSDMFLGLWDKPDFAHGMLRHITDTYESFVKRWYELCPQKSPMHVTWGNGYLGKICLRDDSAMNLSPDMYEEFIFPYNDELLTKFGGGAIHSCGRVDHYVPFLERMKDLTAFNMSQPEYNDMEIVYRNTVDKGIEVFGMPWEEADRADKAGRKFHGLLH